MAIKNIVGFLRAEEGQGMTEYALVLTIIGISIIVAIAAFRDQIISILQTREGELDNAVSTLN